MFNVLTRQSVLQSKWNHASDVIDRAWAWHRWELLEARDTWHRTTDLSFAVTSSDDPGDLVALVPLVLVRPKGIAAAFGPHLESTGGPAISSQLPRRTFERIKDSVCQEIHRLAQQHGVRRTDISCPPLAPKLLQVTGPEPNPLCHFGSSDTSTQSWILDIAKCNEEELWMTIEHRCRKQIKKAQRNMLTTQVVTPDLTLLEKYYELHLQTCQRNGIRPHPRKYFEVIYSQVSNAGMCKACVVSKGEEVLSIHNFLIYKNCALYWTTAGSDAALKLCANDFGIWEALCYMKSIGIQFFESGEAFPGASQGKLKGLNDFKRSFGGSLYPYYRGQIVHRPITECLMKITKELRGSRNDK
ncbi:MULTISPECIES: GNAT family N-acetyltransferase [unclassified Thalassospira]|uniref:GNAT family N-acetyltransferase n=1 Tax=unclassified Thalassospira TaxID=2648997 RepID=UPI000C434018|nr:MULTISPECIES: GNAT family N-acetyltransferase [unclassified Thalassospira]MBC44601.1 hypothetical protein [Thalassospira sp.]HAI32594.1 hypothetical protein [Thalassospira sp.]|tara:strand:- start:5605 stop:6675 length:1071 start_codon:yes stop_codon:yes gene_type:complete